jgi:hypothetical protein
MWLKGTMQYDEAKWRETNVLKACKEFETQCTQVTKTGSRCTRLKCGREERYCRIHSSSTIPDIPKAKRKDEYESDEEYAGEGDSFTKDRVTGGSKSGVNGRATRGGISTRTRSKNKEEDESKYIVVPVELRGESPDVPSFEEARWRYIQNGLKPDVRTVLRQREGKGKGRDAARGGESDLRSTQRGEKWRHNTKSNVFKAGNANISDIENALRNVFTGDEGGKDGKDGWEQRGRENRQQDEDCGLQAMDCDD